VQIFLGVFQNAVVFAAFEFSRQSPAVPHLKFFCGRIFAIVKKAQFLNFRQTDDFGRPPQDRTSGRSVFLVSSMPRTRLVFSALMESGDNASLWVGVAPACISLQILPSRNPRRIAQNSESITLIPLLGRFVPRATGGSGGGQNEQQTARKRKIFMDWAHPLVMRCGAGELRCT